MLDSPKIFFFSLIAMLGSLLLIAWYLVVNAELFNIYFHLPKWVFYSPIILPIIVLIILVYKIFKRNKIEADNDQIRKKDLEALKYGLRLYFQEHGYFPTSQLGKEYYSRGIRIPLDWNSYLFPNHEIMWRYIRHWPLHDPSFDVKNPGGSKYYLYIVSENGKHFALYSYLDKKGDRDYQDYNSQDSLNPSLGIYNYKIAV